MLMKPREKRKPIWTAFITHQILSPTWMSRDSSRVIHLAELNRCVFTEEYNPQRTHTGAHELTFIKRSGTIPLSLSLSFFFRYFNTIYMLMTKSRCQGIRLEYRDAERRGEEPTLMMDMMVDEHDSYDSRTRTITTI